MTITLPPTLQRLVSEKITAGLYATESEVVSDALRQQFAADNYLIWVKEQASLGFDQLDQNQSVLLTEDQLLSHLAQRASK